MSDSGGVPAKAALATITKSWCRRIVFLLTGLSLITLFVCRTWIIAWWHDRPVARILSENYADDASRQNSTMVRETWVIPRDPQLAESQLSELLQFAQRDQLKVAIAGARHSMGGHTITPNGIVIDMLPFHRISLNQEGTRLSVGAGARWSEIIPFLDERGRSVAVMQSNNDFTVGGSISVNCHGWQHNSPPIASTVESFRLMTSDGKILTCSRTENHELFSLALGGYGLFGVILDAEIRTVPNEMYQPASCIVPASQYVASFREQVGMNGDVGMVYGRLCVVPGDKTFLKEAILTVFRQVPGPPTPLKSHPDSRNQKLKREIFRGQIEGQSGKELRWKLEKNLGEQIARQSISRNSLLNESAEVYQDRNADSVDILHEYFIPPERVEEFLQQCRVLIPQHRGELMNVTIRNVLRDDDTTLCYAPEERFAFVCLFHQKLEPGADLAMAKMTRDLTQAALSVGGSYYLPYRLHAAPEQFAAAYPMAEKFFEAKRHWDPIEMFQNRFYEQYGQPAAGGR